MISYSEYQVSLRRIPRLFLFGAPPFLLFFFFPVFAREESERLSPRIAFGSSRGAGKSKQRAARDPSKVPRLFFLHSPPAGDVTRSRKALFGAAFGYEEDYCVAGFACHQKYFDVLFFHERE